MTQAKNTKIATYASRKSFIQDTNTLFGTVLSNL